MLCNQCKKEVRVENEIWTQDFNAKSIVFCSDTCQEAWIDDQFPLRLKRRAAPETPHAIYSPMISTPPN
jgi:hypothetical protein